MLRGVSLLMSLLASLLLMMLGSLAGVARAQEASERLAGAPDGPAAVEAPVQPAADAGTAAPVEAPIEVPVLQRVALAPDTVVTAAAAAPGRFRYRVETQPQWVNAPAQPRFTADIHAAPPGAPVMATVMVMGVAMRTGEHSRLIWQTPVAVNSAGREGTELVRPEMQLAFSLKASDVKRQFRSPLRMALSAQTVLTLKPRKSKFSVHLQHRW